MSHFATNLKGKNVFLTGHTGFKGAWLSIWLNKLGANVTGYSLSPPTEPSLYYEAGVANILAANHQNDLNEREALAKAILESKPDLILHLAAQSVVAKGYEDPYGTLMTNVAGTASLLEAIRTTNTKCAVLCVTSDKCYENIEQVWGYRESDKYGDSDPYGGSKGCAEIVINYYRSSYFPVENIDQHGVALASARAGNVIGGGDWKAHALLCDAYRSLSTTKTIPLRNPNSFRPWQHVLQCLSGYLSIAEKIMSNDPVKYCTGWNIGPLPGSELAVSEVIDLFIEEWGSGAWIDSSDPNQKREANILRLCIDKAIWELNWRPAWTVQESIKHTAKWYRSYLNNPKSAQQLCDEQIELYTAAMKAAN